MNIDDEKDMQEVADAFYEDFIKIGAKMLLVDNMIRDGSLKDTLKAMKHSDRYDLMSRARTYMGIMVRFQKTLAEVENE